RRGYPACAPAQGDAGNAVDFRGGVNLRIDAAADTIAKILNAARLPEVNAACQFAHDHDVEPADQLRLQARGIDQRIEADGRAEVGEQLEIFAKAQQAPLRL